METTKYDPHWNGDNGTHRECPVCGCEHAGRRSYVEPTRCEACEGHEAGEACGVKAERARWLDALAIIEDPARMERDGLAQSLREGVRLACRVLRESAQANTNTGGES